LSAISFICSRPMMISIRSVISLRMLSAVEIRPSTAAAMPPRIASTPVSLPAMPIAAHTPDSPAVQFDSMPSVSPIRRTMPRSPSMIACPVSSLPAP
jgi:hypothetical protein